jgi:hypothetical protein
MLACFGLLRVIDPADELIPPERRQAFPQQKDLRIRSHRSLKVFGGLVDSAMGENVCHETSNQRHPTAEFVNAVYNGGFQV